MKEFKEAGMKRPDWGIVESSNKPKKMKIDHERITIDGANFPYLKGMKMDRECTIDVRVKKVGQRMNEQSGKNKVEEITLEILKIGEPEGDAVKELIKDNETE